MEPRYFISDEFENRRDMSDFVKLIEKEIRRVVMRSLWIDERDKASEMIKRKKMLMMLDIFEVEKLFVLMRDVAHHFFEKGCFAYLSGTENKNNFF